MILAAPLATAQGAPQVVSTTPANGATGVAVNSPITFVFDQAMAKEVPIIPTIPGVFVGNLEWGPASVPSFECDWSADSRSLTCTPDDDLPPNTTITWRLNPSGTLFLISSQGAQAVATTSGSFTTGAGTGGGGGGDDEEPVLVSTTPANGAFGVSVTTAVQFVFDRAMKPTPGIGGAPPFVVGAVHWQAPGLDATKFTYSWSADGRTLTAEYEGDLPGSLPIAWVLNSAEALVRLESEEGIELPEEEYAGGFVTGTGGGGGGDDCEPDGIPSTWGFYSVGKTYNYEQSGAGDPVAALEEPFQFASIVRGPETGPAVTAASVTVPPNTTKELEGVPLVGLFIYFDERPTPAELDAAYPGGNYTLRFTQTGVAERVISMPMSTVTPPAPKIANFAEAQAVNAAQAFTLRWNAFTGASAQDSLNLSISHQGQIVFQAPDLCVPRDLAVTATSIELPANTLVADRTYQASLTFSKGFYFSTNTVPDMAGFGGISSTTEFTVKTGTGGAIADPARFTAYEMLDNGHPRLTLTGTAGRTYTIQRATSVAPGNWQAVGTVVMNSSGLGTFEDLQAGSTLPLFYRAVAL